MRYLLLILLSSYLLTFEALSEPLSLMGSTTFRYYGFKVYDAKVYAPPGTKNVSEILGKAPVRLELRYARALSSKDFIRSGEAYMKDNAQIPFESVKEYSDQMNKLYQDVNEGDVYQIYFEPGQGVQLFLNGTPKGQVKNDRFAIAYLNIWNEDVFRKLIPPDSQSLSPEN